MALLWVFIIGYQEDIKMKTDEKEWRTRRIYATSSCFMSLRNYVSDNNDDNFKESDWLLSEYSKCSVLDFLVVPILLNVIFYNFSLSIVVFSVALPLCSTLKCMRYILNYADRFPYAFRLGWSALCFANF